MEDYKEEAKRLFIECYPNELDNGQFVKGVWAKYYAKLVAKNIIKETIENYSNDENHDRIIFYKNVLSELDSYDYDSFNEMIQR
jgi:hypothetical protein